MCLRSCIQNVNIEPRHEELRSKRGDARNPFQGSLGSGRHWEGEVGSGSFERNNDDEGSREQGEGGEAGLWRCGGGRGGGLGPLYRSREWGARALLMVVVASETTSLMVQN
jgi:hypothetical protein